MVFITDIFIELLFDGVIEVVVIHPSILTSAGASAYISESVTGVWVAEWPLVGGESKDSPLLVGFSTGS